MTFIELIGGLFIKLFSYILAFDAVSIMCFVMMSISAAAYVVTRMFKKKI